MKISTFLKKKNQGMRFKLSSAPLTNTDELLFYDRYLDYIQTISISLV